MKDRREDRKDIDLRRFYSLGIQINHRLNHPGYLTKKDQIGVQEHRNKIMDFVYDDAPDPGQYEFEPLDKLTRT